VRINTGELTNDSEDSLMVPMHEVEARKHEVEPRTLATGNCPVLMYCPTGDTILFFTSFPSCEDADEGRAPPSPPPPTLSCVCT